MSISIEDAPGLVTRDLMATRSEIPDRIIFLTAVLAEVVKDLCRDLDDPLSAVLPLRYKRRPKSVTG